MSLELNIRGQTCVPQPAGDHNNSIDVRQAMKKKTSGENPNILLENPPNSRYWLESEPSLTDLRGFQNPYESRVSAAKQ